MTFNATMELLTHSATITLPEQFKTHVIIASAVAFTPTKFATTVSISSFLNIFWSQ